jgi:hypothetical protein
MSNMDRFKPRSADGISELEKCKHDLGMMLIDAIRHGHFNGSISVETFRHGQRRVLISAGKSYQYIISVDDLPD